MNLPTTSEEVVAFRLSDNRSMWRRLFDDSCSQEQDTLLIYVGRTHVSKQISDWICENYSLTGIDASDITFVKIGHKLSYIFFREIDWIASAEDNYGPFVMTSDINTIPTQLIRDAIASKNMHWLTRLCLKATLVLRMFKKSK